MNYRSLAISHMFLSHLVVSLFFCLYKQSLSGEAQFSLQLRGRAGQIFFNHVNTNLMETFLAGLLLLGRGECVYQAWMWQFHWLVHLYCSICVLLLTLVIDCSTLSICDCTRIRSFSVGSLSSHLLLVDCDIYFGVDVFVPGGQDPCEMDCTWSHCFPQIHVCLWCMEFWYRVLGGDVIRRKAILELVQSRCNQEYRERL